MLGIFPTARLAADRDLAQSVISSTYWGREDDLDIEYSLVIQQNVNLTSRVWWDLMVILSVTFQVQFLASRHVLFNVGPVS